MLRSIIPAVLLACVWGCGSVDTAPLGGPYGGQTDPTDPNSGNDDGSNDNNNSGTDGGTTTQPDSGTTTTKDSGTTTTKDSGTTTTMDSGGGTTTETWSEIFSAYLASGTQGNCDHCHSEGSSASNLYNWLSGKGYINGPSSKLVSTSSSCLSWYGGSMPPGGGSNAAAVSAMNAWAAAGAADN